MSQLFQYRNRDAEVTVEASLLRGDAEVGNGQWWFRTRDGQCNNAQWDDADQDKKPSRHVEFGFVWCSIRFDFVVCVTLMPSREAGDTYTSAGYDI